MIDHLRKRQKIKLNTSRFFLASFSLVCLFGCAPSDHTGTYPTTSIAQLTDTLFIAPTPTILPSQTPAYLYLPVLSQANATAVSKFDQIDGGVSSIAISPNGRYLAASFDNGAGLIWDISAVHGWGEWHSAPLDVFLARGPVSFAADSSVLATGGTLIDLQSKRTIQELPGTVSFSPKGSVLAVNDGNVISLWEYDGNQWNASYEQDTPGTVSLTFSPDGKYLGEALFWGSGEGVNIWEVAGHTLLYNFPPPEHSHPAHFNTEAYAILAFSPDGRFIATSTRDQFIVRIWNLGSGEWITDLDTVVETAEGEYFVPDVECISFSQDSRVIVMAGYNALILKTNPEGELIGLLNLDSYRIYSTKIITACAASFDGRLLAVGDSDGDVSIWGVPAQAP